MKRLILLLALVACVLPLQGASATATVVASGTADVQGLAAQTRLTRLCGYSITEKAGAAAEVIIRAGTSTAGTALADVTLSAGESTREGLWCEDGPVVTSGIFVDRVSGTTTLTLYTRAGG